MTPMSMGPLLVQCNALAQEVCGLLMLGIQQHLDACIRIDTRQLNEIKEFLSLLFLSPGKFLGHQTLLAGDHCLRIRRVPLWHSPLMNFKP